MLNLKRLSLCVVLTLILVSVTLGGEIPTVPCSPNPGEIQTPPCQQSAVDSPSVVSYTRPASTAIDVVVAEAVDLLQDALLLF